MFSFEQEVEPVARLLLSIPGLNVQYCFTRHPHILVCGVPTLLMRRVGEALTARLGLHGGDLGRIVGKYPWVLSQPLKQRTLPLLDYLDSLGATQDQQRRLFKKTPMMMGYPIAAWQRRLQYLQVEAGLSEEAAVLAVLRHPQIVCVGTPACDRWLRWLVDLGMPLANVPHTLTRLPALLTYGGEKRDSFLRFMRDELQLPDAAICRVLFHAPDTMSRNVERLRHNVAAMRDCGLSDAQIRRLVAANPSTLRYDLAWPTYADKLAFLREHLLREDETLPDKVVTYPFYLSYRLDRIAGRTAYLKELGMPISSLQAWLAINERRFCEEWCKTDVASFHSFLQHWRGTSEGQRWLGLAERRKALMSDERIAFEAAADARTDAAVAADASARADKAAARASRLRASIGVLEANAEDAAVHGKEAEAEEARKQAALLARQARYWQREADRLQPEASGGGDGAGAGGEAGAARQEEVAAV
ncbi:Mitochondrial transcription termination factor [Micractinium conductrix]|uniref:Mitochondrial transcription termination factor n=1 Tax=Micractinium conductrix TaxID=554055 RepID=A0A2P6VHT6_9CHLO|nr:Mitochondrial transcription termination factor [Micractinium conductrix]|eukprot:PSC73655.1 Mitochondrial transcription termination factor [Micractinium conductrix]